MTPEKVEPNETTRRAMALVKAKELGKIPDDSPVFTDVQEMMNYLDCGKVGRLTDTDGGGKSSCPKH
ncbi:hypothetical protein [Levilactobacillus wangkuiensis]|uniref:hypothetical protein n=1 Tax=Levilactobacillus wangkuiensis TaxID=2799566 RepID=UPI0019451889|nr:hypothetical protein [Levilactobacillus wangkuiensis]